jgi:hypothetical protein
MPLDGAGMNGGETACCGHCAHDANGKHSGGDLQRRRRITNQPHGLDSQSPEYAEALECGNPDWLYEPQQPALVAVPGLMPANA